MSAISTPHHHSGSTLRAATLLASAGTTEINKSSEVLNSTLIPREAYTSIFPLGLNSLPRESNEFKDSGRSGSLLNTVTAAFNPTDTDLTQRLITHHELNEINRILRHGTNEPNGKPIYPYQFRGEHGHILRVAEAAGLEGFIFSEKKFSAKFGEEASVAQLQNYFQYTLTLLNGARKTQNAREQIQQIRNSNDTPNKKYSELISFLRSYVSDLQRMVLLMDQAHWSLSARMYHIYIRPFNLSQWRATQGIVSGTSKRESGRFFRDFDKPELDAVKNLSLS